MGRIIAFTVLFVVLTFGFRRPQTTQGLTPDLTTAIKGVAAVMIVLTHSITFSPTVGRGVTYLSTGWLTVTVFFFLSGFGSAYGLCRKEGYAKHFLRNRFVRVLIPYLLAHVFYGLYRCFVARRLTMDELLHGFFSDRTIVPLTWYPVVALSFYLLIYLAFRIASRPVSRLAVLAGLVAGFTFLEWGVIGSEFDHWFISNFSFVFGAALQILDPQLRYRRFVLPAAAVCTVGGFGILPVCNRLFGTYIYPAYILSTNFGSALLTTALLLLLTITGKSNKVTLFLGKCSYEIYLYHMLFIYFCRDVLHWSSWYAMFALTIAAVIPFAALMHIPNSFLCNKLCIKGDNA